VPDIKEPPFVPDRERPSRAECRRFAGGHAPHYIQVRLAHRSPEDDWQRVVVMSAVDDVVVLAADGELHRYRNHEPGYLLWAVGQVGAEALFNTDYKVLILRPGADGGQAVFTLRTAEDPLEPCRPEPDAGSPDD
jgi:hypothetical protein